jgi:ferric-dicitrate binding protein FerR (iron transport regulator)
VRRIFSLLCVLGLAATSASAEPVGFFASLKGEVQVAPAASAGAPSWQAALQDGPVGIGDRVKTGIGAAARLVLVDDTLLHIDEDTEIEIETFHVGDAATRERSIVRQTRGRLRTLVGDAFGGETRLEVHTPTAVVGVKGTDFETDDASLPSRPRWRMCLHSGAISVSNGMGGASPRPGHCVFAEQGRPPSAEFPNPKTPFEAPGGREPVDGDFTEEVDWDPSQPGPANDDPSKDDGDLRIFDPPDSPRGNPPPFGFSVSVP